MGILSNFTDAFKRQNIGNKAPQFVISNFTSNNPFQALIKDEPNYYDQYILYTFRAIDYISNKVASSKLTLWDIAADKKLDEKENIFKDLKSFNPYMNLWEARKLKEMHLLLTGAAYWYIDRSEAQIQLYPLDPTKMEIKTDAFGLPSMYLYQDGNGRLVNIDLNDIIYFRRVNPSNWFEGISQVKQLNYWLSAYIQGTQYNMNKLANNINIDKFLVLPGITPDEKEKIEYQLRNKYGGVRNAGKTGVLDVEPKILDVQSSARELDFVNGMKMLRQDILAGFGIPEALIFPSATNSNTKEARVLFQADTLEPLLEQEKAVLNEQYIPKYSLKPLKKTYEFRFEDIVDQDVNALYDQAVKFVNAGIFTRNEALQHVGKEPVANGDIYVNAGAAPQTDTTIKELKQKSATIAEQLNKILEEKEENEMQEKYLKLADDQEGLMYQTAESFFFDQFKRVDSNLQKAKSISVQNVFKFKDEVDQTKLTFNTAYAKVMSNTSDVGNVEIKEKLLKNNNAQLVNYKIKSISGTAINEIQKKLDYFSNVINETTRDELTKLIVNGLENGFDVSTFRAAIKDLFNSYIDGQGNINTLTSLGFYSAPIEIDANGNIVGNSGDRYKDMFNRITTASNNREITSLQTTDALKALRGLIDPSDAIGKQVDFMLNSMGVNKTVGISASRAVTIARTEATFARNLTFNDLYEENPYIKGKKWNAAGDSSTRDSHIAVSGTVVKSGEFFRLAGGDLRFPGDTSLGAGAEEIVNCRCRITSVVI